MEEIKIVLLGADGVWTPWRIGAEQINALKSLLERSAMLAEENTTTILQKLSQEEALRRELVSNWNEQREKDENMLMLLQDENEKLQARLQRTETWEHSAKVENEELREKCREFQEMSTSLAKELELKLNVEQERNIQHTEIQTLREKLDMMTCLMQDKETTFQQKVAEEEAKTAEANAKFAAYKKELARFNREHQNYLKEERNIQETEIQTLREELDMMTCLMQEKETTFQQKVAEEAAKTAEANAKFAAYKKELARFNREHQNYLNEERKSHKNVKEELDMMNCLMQEKEATFQRKLMEESAKMAQEQKEHQEQINALKSLLERSAMLAEENTTTLLQKLSQEEALRRELVSNWNEQREKDENMLMLLQDENEKLQARLQRTETWEHSAKVENEELREKCKEFQEMSTSLAKELELKLNVERERNIQHTEIQTLREKLDMMTCLMQDKETTFQQKVAEEEAKTAEANAKFAAYKKELARFNKEHQNYLKEERNIQETEIQTLREELDMMTCLMQEKEATFQQKVTEEEAKTAEANAKFAAYKKELARFNREHQNYLKEERIIRQTEIQTLREELDMMNCLMQEKEATFQRKLMEESAKMAQEQKEHQEQINALKSLLERSAMLAEENTTTLLQKLSQEEALRRELVSNWNEQREKDENMLMLLQDENEKLQARLQRTETLEHSAKVENEELREKCKEFQEMSTSMAKELELKLNVEQERNIQHTEIQTLREKLDMMTCLMQDKETTFQQKVAEEEAKTAEANAKFAAYKKELARFNREHQNYLKEERNIQETEIQTLREELDMMTCLMQEKETTFQQKVAEEAAKTAEANAKFAAYKKELARFNRGHQNYLNEERNIQQTEIQTLQEELDMMNCLMQEKEATFQQKLMEESAKMAQEQKEHQEQINALKSLLERSAMLAEENTTTLLQKLSQEEALRRELVSNWNEQREKDENMLMLLQDENEKLQARLQRTETWEHSAKVENEELREKCREFQEMSTSLAKELELKLNVEQERNIQHTEIQTLREELDMMTCLMQEKEATFQQKVAEEEAKTAEANAKFAAYKKELARFNREHQNYLKEERNIQETEIQTLREELDMMTCLMQEKETTFQQKVAEEAAKTAEANAKFAAYKKELARFNRGHQNYLNEERNIQQTEIQTLREELDMMNCLMQEKEATFQRKLMEESAKMAQEQKEHQEQINALKSLLERSAMLAEENTTTLLQKLSQEEALRRELVSNWNEQREKDENMLMLLQDENEKLQARLQRTETWEHSAKVENEELREKCKEFQEMSTSLAKDLELKLNVEQERNIQHTEIQTLREKLDMMTCLMQEKETTFQLKVAEEEAKTAEANAKFAAYKKELARFNKEHQNYLNEERKSHKNVKEELDMMNCLMQEKEATFQQKVAEEAAKTAEANAKFAAYKKELARFNREHQNYLNEERNIQQTEIQTLQEELDMMNCLMQEKEATFQRKLMEESAKMAQEQKEHQEQINALKSLLERSAMLAEENTTTLLQKLSQEEALRRELVSNWNEQREKDGNMLMLLQDENEKLQARLQRTETWEHSAKVENEELREKCKEFQEMSTSLAKELELKLNVEQERNIQHTEIQTLREKLDMMTCLMQDKETTFQQKVAEEEAKTAEANAKFAAYKKELARFNREHQNYLNEERNIQETEIQTLREELDMMTCLMQEKETTFQQKVAEEAAKTAEANAKFAAYKKELARFNREHQNYLNEERKSHKNVKEELDMMNCLMQEKEATFQRKLMEESAKMAQEQKEHQEQINALKSLLERSAMLAEENTTTLLQKLSQEEALRRELVSNWNEQREKDENMLMLLQDENEKLQARLQRTETSEHSAKVENEELREKCKEFQEMSTSLAKELELKLNVEQEWNIQHTEIQTLREKLDMMTCLMQEKEATFQQKVAEEEAKTAEANAKFAAYKKELARFNREHQNYLNEERNIQETEIQTLREELDMMTCLMQEKETTFQQKVAEEAAKTAEANAKFAAYKKELARFNREHQNYLNEERKSHKNVKEELDMMNCLMQEKEATFQRKLMEESAKMAQEQKEHQEQINALKSLLERSAMLAEENTTTLLQKLSQEEALRRELVSNWNEQREKDENMLMLLQDENEKLQARLQRTETLEHSAKVENEELREKCKEFQEMSTSLAKELELKLNVEQERNIQHTEIQTLREKLDMMTCLMQDKETTFQQKVAEEEAKTAKANAKFAAYKKELARFNWEHQNYLNEKGRGEAQEKLKHEESTS